MMRYSRPLLIALFVLGMAAGMASTRAEEILLFDGSRVHGFVSDVSADGKELVVERTEGEPLRIALENVVAVRFLGRRPLSLQTGTQEVRFLQGGRLRGQIRSNESDTLMLDTTAAGEVAIDLGRVKGFVALPLMGSTGRKAEALVESDHGSRSAFVDVVLNNFGSEFDGVVCGFDSTAIKLDSERYLRSKDLGLATLAAVRLADATRSKMSPWKGELQVRIHTRDGSMVQGVLEKLYLGRWHLKPHWHSETTLSVDLHEITLVQVLGGKVQYLSHLDPAEVKEQTLLSPPQPYRMDQSCQGDDLTIAGRRYPWGIGVHADSALSFDLGGRFKEFLADVGVADRVGTRGSVIFTVLGDGKPLAKTKVLTGRTAEPETLKVGIEGVRRLTLKVSNAGDLDLGDVANWGSARVTR